MLAAFLQQAELELLKAAGSCWELLGQEMSNGAGSSPHQPVLGRNSTTKHLCQQVLGYRVGPKQPFLRC